MENTPPPPCQLQEPEQPRRKRLTFRNLAEIFKESIARFPITFAYIAGFAVWGVIDCWISDKFSTEAPLLVQNLEPSLWFLFITGIMLSLTISLWCEYTGKIKLHWISQIIANVLLLADFVYMVFNLKTMSAATYIAHTAIEFALITAIIFVPAIRRLSVRQSLIFSFIQFSNLLICSIISLALTAAYFIIHETIRTLFGHIDYRVFSTIEIVFGATLTIIIFVSRVPRLTETIRRAETFKLTKFISGLIKYIALPLTIIYMLILYAYGIDILLHGEMPRGIICYMTSAATFATFLTLFLLRAIEPKDNENDNMISIAVRWLPIALIPLLSMMSVAIGQRISQYGITPDRLYVVTFNIWAYGAAIYLFATKSRQINKVAQSFAIVFLLTSIIPNANYTTIVQQHMRNRIFSILMNAGIDKSQLPLSHERLEKVIENMDKASWDDLSSKLKYLDSHEDHSLTEDIVDFEIEKGYYSYDELFETNDVDTIENINIEFGYDDDTVMIPQGYNCVTYHTNFLYNIKADESDNVDISINPKLTVKLNIDSLKTISNSTEPKQMLLPVIGDSCAVYVPSEINYNIIEKDYAEQKRIDYINVYGYLFINKQAE